MKKLEGSELAKEMMRATKKRFTRYRENGRAARFTTVLVDDNPASARYIAMKQAEGAQLGVEMDSIHLPANTAQAQLNDTIEMLSNADEIDAVLVQYPIPPHLDYLEAIGKLSPQKDADGLHPANLGLIFHDPKEQRELLPATPQGIIQLLEHGHISLKGSNIAVVGRGLTVGAPLSALLTAKNNGPSATVTTLHQGTRDIGKHTRTADIVIAAAGSPGLIGADDIREGATLVAVGVSYVEGKATSDFTPAALKKAGVVVPVVNGVGPMTRANLWANVARCYELCASVK